MHLRAKTVTRDVRAVLLGLCLVVGASVQAQQPNALRLPDPLTRAAAAAGLPVPATSVAIPEAATPAGRALPTAPPTDDPSASALDTARLSSQLQVAAAAQSVREAEAEAARAQRAQADALLRAEQAASEVARAVAAEQARIEAQRLALAQAQRALAKRQQEQGGAIGRLVEREAVLVARARDPQLRSQQADALFHEVVGALEEGRDAFAEALTKVRGVESQLPAPLSPPALLTPPLDGADEAERRALALAHDTLDSRRASLLADERHLVQGGAAELADHLQRLTDLRAEVIAKMSPDVRDELFGFTGAGVRQLLRELRHLRLMAEWYPTSRLRLLEIPDSFDTLLVRVGTILGSLFRFLLAALAWLLLRRRWRPLIEALSGWLAQRKRRSTPARLGYWATRLVLTLGRELFIVLAVMLLFRVVLGADVATELDLVYELLLDWALYRLLLAGAHRFLTAAAADAARREISPELSERILASLRLGARFGLAVALTLALASHLLGRGYLYMLVVRLSWIFAIPIVLLLVRAWQQDICAAYLRAYPSGSLATVVERNRERSFGVLVALAAFSAVAVTGIAAWVGEISLRFEQTRRGLAYVFRRRLERQSLGLSQPVADVAQLPPALREVLAEAPVAPDAFIGEPEAVDDVVEAVVDWSGGGGAFALALVGGWGVGKTSWLDHVCAQIAAVDAPPEIVRIEVPRGVHDETALVALLADALGETEAAARSSAAALGETLGHGARRLVVLDNAGRVVRKAMGGMACHDALATLVARSMPRVGWMLAYSDHAHRRVAQLRGDRDLFTRRVMLRAWDEDRIGELVADRMHRSGFTAHFDDLVDPDLDVADALVEGVRIGERFVRLLWDQSDGNPRDVLHFWARSLAPYGPTDVNVRLFAAPSVDALESLGAQARFALHAVLVHDGLTAAEAGAVLFETEAVLVGVLGWLEGRGILRSEPDEDGKRRFRVDAHWMRAVVRYLQRKHLLVR
ncbi:MAG: hypothetical protein RIT45_3956 [Pseudomonadota bacterium]|jgi:hypothetical protein